MLKLFNTLSRRREIFEPLGDVVGIYTCGPSVYQHAHIGNFRTFVFEDVLVRYLRFKGFKVRRVMNITDLEDKAIETARNEGKKLKELTEYYSKIFFEDMKTLNLSHADVFPKATENVLEIIDVIKKIMKNGYAYYGDDGSIYFDVSKFNDYGKLSNFPLKKGKKRIKRDDWGEDTHIYSDFALWKSYEKEDGDIFWDTDLGKGRPGWHIECSAMCSKHLGIRFDIHAGGVDNIFPHHENVIAQNFAAFGVNPSRYWLHCRHLMVNGKKMSKSAGNFYILRDLTAKGFNPMAVKYLLVSMNYRRRLNFTFESLGKVNKEIDRIQHIIEILKNANGTQNARGLIEKAMKRFEHAMDDNLNTARGLNILEELVEDISRLDLDKPSAQKMLEALSIIDSIFGFGFSISK